MARDIASSLLSTFARPFNGIQCKPSARQPQRTLRLYDIENCPYCRLVREALTELNLDVEIYPCPKGGERFRPWVMENGGKAQFPYLVDPNTGEQLYESLDIVRYLFETYGDGSVPMRWRAGRLHTLGSIMASIPRVRHGRRARAAGVPEQMLELYSFESSPYARVVREWLSEHEVPYIVRNCGRTRLTEWLLPPVRSVLNIQPDSEVDNRRKLQSEQGRVSIPFLFDPNTGEGLFESTDILHYLEETWGAVTPE